MTYRVLVYGFALFLAVFANRITRAIVLYNELGWTATWAEIGSWGTSFKTEAVSATSKRGLA